MALRLEPLRGHEERNRLVVRHSGLVGTVLRTYFRPSTLALLGGWEDAYQVGMTGLMRGAELYREGQHAFGTYAGWWVRSAICTAVKKTAKAKRKRMLARGCRPSWLAPRPPVPDPADVVADADELEWLARQVAALPSHCALAVRLVHLEGRTLKDAGRRAGVHWMTLRRWLAEGMAALKAAAARRECA